MLLKYLEWISPDVVECFFPVAKNKERRFRWPGLGSAVSCLLLEAVCLLIGAFLYVLMTVGYGCLLATGSIRDTITPGVPPASASTRGETFTVTKLDASDHKMSPGFPAIIQGFMARSEPVIIKNLPKSTFSTMKAQYAPQATEEMVKRGTVLINFCAFPRVLGEYGEWMQKHIQRPVIALLRLSGQYGSIPAHMDGYTYNIYHVARGRKRVWICPRDYNHLLNLQSAPNSVIIPGSDRKSTNQLEWIQSVPGVWHFDLEAGDVLIFNNTACVHKFVNVSDNPEIFSLRVFNRDMSPVLARHHLFNWQQSKQYAKLMFSMNKVVEKPADVDKRFSGAEDVKSD